MTVCERCGKMVGKRYLYRHAQTCGLRVKSVETKIAVRLLEAMGTKFETTRRAEYYVRLRHVVELRCAPFPLLEGPSVAIRWILTQLGDRPVEELQMSQLQTLFEHESAGPTVPTIDLICRAVLHRFPHVRASVITRERLTEIQERLASFMRISHPGGVFSLH
jgi:hypothetical protein